MSLKYVHFKIRFTSTVTLTDAGHVSSTRERIVELVKGALVDTDYKVKTKEHVCTVHLASVTRVNKI